VAGEDKTGLLIDENVRDLSKYGGRRTRVTLAGRVVPGTVKELLRA
jgi:hypothetical protein